MKKIYLLLLPFVFSCNTFEENQQIGNVDLKCPCIVISKTDPKDTYQSMVVKDSAGTFSVLKWGIHPYANSFIYTYTVGDTIK